MKKCAIILLLCLAFPGISELFAQSFPARTYKIGIIRNPGSYAEAMRDGFLETLKKAQIGELVVKDELGYASDKDVAKNIAIGQNFVEWGADLIVTIGSSTSHAVGGHLKGTPTPILFLGITDPVGGGLIPALGQPGKENITGVTFPIPVHRTIGTLARIFPNARNFCFVYDRNLPPDAMYVRWVKQYAQQNPKPVILFLDTDKEKGIPEKELKEADLFIGWYSLHLYKYATMYPQAPFAGNTVEECKENAVLAIYPKLPDLGAQGAEMALRILKDKTKAGDIPAQSPQEYGLCFNLRKIKELGFRIPKDILDLSDVKVE